MRGLLGALLLVAGCASGDPCDGIGGTCIPLTVTGTRTIDQLLITVTGSTSGSQITPAQPRIATLPQKVALTFHESFLGGLRIDVVGLLQGNAVARGSTSIIKTEQRKEVIVELGSGGGTSDGSFFDFGGTDGGGFDFALPPSGLILHYPLDGNANEATGTGLTGAISGAASTSDRKGNSVSAFSFSTATDRINLPAIPALGASYTVSLWALWPSIPSYADPEGGRIISNENGTVFNGIFALTLSTSISKLQVFAFDSTFRHATANFPSSGTWHHLAGVVTPTVATLYVDGTEAGTAALSGQSGAGSRPWTLGNAPSGPTSFRGSLDDVKIFNRALAPGEIAALASQ